MDNQPKLTDKLRLLLVGGEILDLVVIGCGPAILALAAESAKLGLKVGLIGPDLPFTNNYGVWEDEFKDLGLERCIEHVWRDTIVYLDERSDPILVGRAYGRVSRQLLHEELLSRCVESGVLYRSSKVDRIFEANDGHSVVACEDGVSVPCRLVTVASGAASGKLLQYEVGGPRVSVQTAYGVDISKILSCLASKDAMAFDLLKRKLMSRLETMGVKLLKIYEEEWSYIPVGGSLPNTEQKNLAFGAAATMVHPATGYSVVRSLSEAPNYASVIAKILKGNHSKDELTYERNKKCQRSFFLFGLALILQLDIDGIRTFFRTFFRLPNWMSQGFLGSTLSSADLAMRIRLVRHLLSDPTGATMIRTYLTL
ncbi:hypothetical protein K2173_004515 [Erythroxylum novogranatense]|uniref:Lycopene epsilon cyclase n=1 Tax=Erythroxylum novogranatense TaxID=1862640 RepID=A0AAV8TIG2_9ROSI|nr:hypothetical protein K2173_004515 [Erythroxylum novogranatense]